MAASRTFSPFWVGSLGRRILAAIRAAEVLFVHIPKTGGTSISRKLYRRNLPHYTAPFWYSTFGRPVSDLPSFSVVRHPVERMVSAYKMARAGGTDIIAYSRYWQGRLRGLETFDAFVDHVFANRAQLAVLPLDLRTQAEFILDGDGAVMVDRLYSLNGRRGMPAELGRRLAIHPIPHLNASPPHPLDVTTATRRKIEEIYVTDFEIYHYLEAGAAVADIRGRRFPGPLGSSPARLEALEA